MARLSFGGMLFVARGALEPLAIRELSVSTGAARNLFASFALALKAGTGFRMSPSGADGQPLPTISLTVVGSTAALFRLSRPNKAGARDLRSATVLLSKLDREDDRDAMRRARGVRSLRDLSNTAFEVPLALPGPVAVSYFADVEAASCPACHTVIRILSAAFFSQFGIANENPDAS